MRKWFVLGRWVLKRFVLKSTQRGRHEELVAVPRARPGGRLAGCLVRRRRWRRPGFFHHQRDGGAPVAFSFLANGIEGHTGEALQRIDRVVESIASARRR